MKIGIALLIEIVVWYLNRSKIKTLLFPNIFICMVNSQKIDPYFSELKSI